MNDGGRPDAEALLRAVQKINGKIGRGRLRVFLGMCPGVGKTYAMLKAAREQVGRQTDVAIGLVETHGRKETEELISGLKVLPRRYIEYKGSRLSEMDLDLILTTAPQLVLVDELAHTNAPGSRHTKRYQDVQEILAAGIDVYTTINIQHIESRNDAVAQITNVSVKETVPDSFLELADQVEVIDLSPQELLFRLKEGKVYLGDRAEAAAQNFFKEERLTALRELALRFTAEKVDQDLSDQMTIKGIEGPWNTNERILVAVSYSPYSGRLIRAARRMAYNLEAPWIALYVDTGDSLAAEDEEMLQKNLALARELGAEVITMADTNLNNGIQKICRDKNVTQIIMGRPDKRFLRDFLARGTLLDQLVSTTSKIDVHVIRAPRQPRYRGFRLIWPSLRTGFFPYFNTACLLAAQTVICYTALPYVGYKAIGPVYLLAILLVASLTGRGPIFFAAVVSTLIWDFIFIPPQFTLAINSSEDGLMVLSFFTTALVGGFLTSRIRKQEEILVAREARAQALYALGTQLSESTDQETIAKILLKTVKGQFNGVAHVLLAADDGKLSAGKPPKLEDNEYAVATWSFEHGKPAGWSTPTLSGAKCLCIPLKGNSQRLGVMALYPAPGRKQLTIDQQSFMGAVIDQASVALERLRFGEIETAAKLYETSERLHQTLLNSISHEMRTPLTIIMGSASALSDKNNPRDERHLDHIAREMLLASDRLNRVIENLLDMSRLNSGILALKLDWSDLNDLAGVVVKKQEVALGSHKVLVNFPADLPLALIDFRFIEHALSNLLLNAINYSPPGSAIDFSARVEDGHLRFRIEDRGPGIPLSEREKIFEKFYRLPGTPTGGTGLGLSIARTIVEAHKGSLTVEERVGGGASFVISLPMSPPPDNPKAHPDDRQ